jgi:hypothetical protein
MDAALISTKQGSIFDSGQIPRAWGVIAVKSGSWSHIAECFQHFMSSVHVLQYDPIRMNNPNALHGGQG